MMQNKKERPRSYARAFFLVRVWSSFYDAAIDFTRADRRDTLRAPVFL